MLKGSQKEHFGGLPWKTTHPVQEPPPFSSVKFSQKGTSFWRGRLSGVISKENHSLGQCPTAWVMFTRPLKLISKETPKGKKKKKRLGGVAPTVFACPTSGPAITYSATGFPADSPKPVPVAVVSLDGR